MTAWTVCQTPGPGMSAARAPGPWSMARPGRPGTSEERAVAGRPTPAGAAASGVAILSVLGSESPKMALMEACLNQGLRRKRVYGRLQAIFWRLANRCPERVIWSSAQGACAGVDLRPAASDAGMPSSCRRFRPRSSRRPVFSDAGERETAPPGASSEPLPDKHAGRSRNNAAAGALFYSV